MSLVEMRGIEKRFSATVALDGVDIFLEPGEVHALLGENGSGKSTLMRVLAGAIRPDAGQMKLDGSTFSPSSPLDARLKGVAMIYQELALCPDLTVAENIMLGMERPDSLRVAEDALAQLGHRDIDPHTLVRRLPINQCQIVEIARAVASKARVVILDEPTSSLSEPDVQKLFAVIRSLRERGHAVVYISHFLNEIEEIADRVTVLRGGKHIATEFVGKLSQAEMVSMMVGRTISDAYPRSSRTPGEPILEISGVTGFAKPIGVDLSVRRGEVVGIAGLNGSGRTELLRCIFGLDTVKSGSLRVQQVEGSRSPHQRWVHGVGMLSEDRKSEGLALDLSIASNLTLTRLPGVASDAQLEKVAPGLIERAGIKCRGPHQPVGQLSGGNQQKVAFARLLYHDVDLLLLDEPTRGIDVGSKQQIYAMIDELAKQGKAVLMVSSYLPELLGVCDRIAVMHKGHLGPARPVAELSQETLMREATGA